MGKFIYTAGRPTMSLTEYSCKTSFVGAIPQRDKGQRDANFVIFRSLDNQCNNLNAGAHLNILTKSSNFIKNHILIGLQESHTHQSLKGDISCTLRILPS